MTGRAFRRTIIPLAVMSVIAPVSRAGGSLTARASASLTARAAASMCSAVGSSSVFGFSGGVKLVSQTTIPVCETGGVTVSFIGDRATGCAARGLCAYAGTESWAPSGGGDLTLLSYRAHGRRGLSAILALGDGQSPVTARVQRTSGAGGVTVCRDRSDAFTGFVSPTVRDRQITLRLDSGATPLLGTRCAGPLDVDLGRALPAITLPLRSVIHGQTAIDLTDTRSFAGNGFAGIVRSTLVLRLGRARTSAAGFTAGGGGKGRRTRQVTVRYRVEGLRGASLAHVHAAGDPTRCAALDACALSGTIGFAPGSARGGDVYVTAIGSARHPYRDFLAALGLRRHGNPIGIEVAGAGEQPLLHGTVSASLHQAGDCRDTTALRSAEISLQTHAGGVSLAVSPYRSQAGDPLRTRCPGPALATHDLARTVFALRTLARPRFSIALRAGGFRDRAYRVSTTADLILTLRRVGVTTQTFSSGLP